MVWVSLIISIAVSLVSYALSPKPEPPPPAAQRDLQTPKAQAGIPIPVVFGYARIQSPNFLWWGDLKKVPIVEDFGDGK